MAGKGTACLCEAKALKLSPRSKDGAAVTVRLPYESWEADFSLMEQCLIVHMPYLITSPLHNLML